MLLPQPFTSRGEGDLFADYYRGLCLEALGRAAEARVVPVGMAARPDASAPTPPGCLVDSGAVYAAHGEYAYGWR